MRIRALDLKTGRTGKLATLAAALVIGLAAAPSASAAVSCDYEPGLGLVNVQTTAQNDQVLFAVGQSGDIKVYGGASALSCTGGDPTVTNTDTIILADNSDNPDTAAPGDGDNNVSIVDPGAFGPGKTQEQGDPAFSEIEFIMTMNGGNDQLSLLGSSGADHWALGNGGINFNAGSGDPSPDADLISSVFDNISVHPGAGDDVFTAQGGLGTGAAYSRDTTLGVDGGVGDDVLEGGTLGDSLRGSIGNDTLRGFGGDDRLAGEAGDDTLDGGAGADLVDYGYATAGASVDLATTAPQATGMGTDTLLNDENVQGGPGPNRLSGNASANRLTGGQGDDTLDGRGGDDTLDGLDGNDTATYADAPGPMTVDLTTGAATGDGTDTLANIDNVIGSPFADTLLGDAGPNAITGGPGNDTVAGLAGADTIDVRDGGPDTASCGTEIDSAKADRKSVDQVNADCETVDYLPEPPAPPTSTTGTTGTGTQGGGAADAPGGPNDRTLAFTLRGAHTQRVLRRKAVLLTATCPLETCTTVASATGRLRRSVTLKPVTKRVEGGATTKVKLRLSRAQLRALRSALQTQRRPKLEVTVIAIDAAGNAVTRSEAVAVKR